MTPTPVTTRHAEHADLAAVARLFDAYRQFYQMPPDLPLATAYIQARLTRAESVILVAHTGTSDIQGFCQLYPSFCSVMAGPIFTLYDLYVAPSARQTGCGKALMTAAEQYATEQGAVRMDLSTAKTNHRAQSLYSAAGWTQEERFYTYSKLLEAGH